MQVGIIGLPNTGKSTLFNALTNASAAVANYPFCTIEPNVGVINVPDENLVPLSKIYNSYRITPATIKVLDMAGLVKGASKGEGLGNKFLSHIRTVDILAHVVRCFYDENVAHVKKEMDPSDDVDIINTELLLADIEILERTKEKLSGIAKSGDSMAKLQLDLANYLLKKLDNGEMINLKNLDKVQRGQINNLNLLSLKPTLYIANMDDKEESRKLYQKLADKVGEENIIKIYAKLESELLELGEEERKEYRKEFGIEKNTLNYFIKVCYKMLNLITFYTINENETKAHSLKRGQAVIKAAGKIHSDMEKGFIKAEVINCRKVIEVGSFHDAREKGMLKIEGKDYVVQDEDVIQIKFSV